MGSFFPNFGVFAMQKLQKMGVYSRKIPKNGCLFLTKWPLNMSKGFEAQAADSRPNQIWVTPPPYGDDTKQEDRRENQKKNKIE